jgi:hypothetical protein
MKPVYEMRTYHVTQGKMDALIARFAGDTEPLFRRHNMKTLGYWVPQENSKNLLLYILEHESLEAANKNWDAFRADEEWKKVRAETERDGPLVDSIDSCFMDKIAIS